MPSTYKPPLISGRPRVVDTFIESPTELESLNLYCFIDNRPRN